MCAGESQAVVEARMRRGARLTPHLQSYTDLMQNGTVEVRKIMTIPQNHREYPMTDSARLSKRATPIGCWTVQGQGELPAAQAARSVPSEYSPSGPKGAAGGIRLR